MTQTTLTVIINSNTKKGRFFYNKQLALGETIAVELFGLVITDTPELYIIYKGENVAVQATWSWDTDHFEADLDLDTDEMIDVFENTNDQSLKSFTICVRESGVLYLNDLLDIMNNPYLPAGTASTPAINHIIHDNVDDEFDSASEKLSVTDDDLILIEDSLDGYSKKHVKASTLKTYILA